MTMHNLLTCVEDTGANSGICPDGYKPVLVTGYVQTTDVSFDAGQMEDAFNAGFIIVLCFYLLGACVGAVVRVFRSND